MRVQFISQIVARLATVVLFYSCSIIRTSNNNNNNNNNKNVVVVDAYHITTLRRSTFVVQRPVLVVDVSYPRTPSSSSSLSWIVLSSSIVPSDVEEDDDEKDFVVSTNNENHDTTTTATKHEEDVLLLLLKQKFIDLCATYDRGFGISTSARNKVDTILQQIQSYNTVTIQYPPPVLPYNDDDDDDNNDTNNDISMLLLGNWTMIYTTAFDVLSLQTSPFFIPGAIYQVYGGNDNSNNNNIIDGSKKTLTTVTNIIDFIPRYQSLFVSLLPSSSPPPPTTLIRATVNTRAGIPRNSAMNRIGLIFDSVSIQPIELFGFNSATVIPPLAINLPKLPSFGTKSETTSSTATPPSAPGYFDITYLDDTLLIIRQNTPGGIFCLLRTSSIDP